MSYLKKHDGAMISRIERIIPYHYVGDKDYARYVYKEMRTAMGYKLLDLLEESKFPITIDFEEKTTQMPVYNGDIFTGKFDEKIWIELIYVPVQITHLEIQELLTSYDPIIQDTLLDRFKNKVRGWFIRGHK